MQCHRCEGNGETNCFSCAGEGHDGNGQTCQRCQGDGCVSCYTCNGTGLLD